MEVQVVTDKTQQRIQDNPQKRKIHFATLHEHLQSNNAYIM